jgi:hypothetical protein
LLLSLPGQAATATVSDKHVQLDWRHVFHVTRDVTFSLYAGTEPGYGNVINHVITTDTRYDGHITVVVTSPLYVIIQAIYDNGASNMYQLAIVV